jgi:hypothetical protein
MLVSVIAAAVLAAQGSAAAAPPDPASAAQAAPAAEAAPTATVKPVNAPAKPKRVCVEETQIGSLFSKRICATPEEWEKRRRLDTEAMSQMSGNAPPR